MPDQEEQERDRIIREHLENRLSQEKERLSKVFSPTAEFSFDKENGYWNVKDSFSDDSPLSGQEITCSLRAASGYSRIGGLGGFKLTNLDIGGHVVFDHLVDDFDFGLIPVLKAEDGSDFTRLLDQEVMLFDPDAGEILFFGLSKPEHLVGILHELEHGRLDRNLWYQMGKNYKFFANLDGDIAYAKDRLENDDEMTEQEKSGYEELANYQVDENDMTIIRTILEEELRADLNMLKKLTSIASDVFPKDKDLIAVKALLSERIKTYVDGAKSIGAGKYITLEEEDRIINLAQQN